MLPPARPDELAGHYRRIRDAVPDPDIYAYIFPERTGLAVPPPLFAEVAQAAGLAGAKISGSASADLAGYVAAAPGLRIFSGNDANPWATMRAGGAGVISGRSATYPEVYAALVKSTPESGPGARRSGWTGSWRSARASAGSSTRWGVRGLAGTAARMTRRPAGPGAGRRDRGRGLRHGGELDPFVIKPRVNLPRGWRVLLYRGPA